MTLLAVGVTCCAAAAFWFVQNQLQGAGGNIAAPKLVWLALAIFAWYLLPPILASDDRQPSVLRRAHWLFWLNMLARGVIELWMIYGTKNWHPYYGAAHDVASAGLLVYLTRAGAGPLRWHAFAISAMLLAETSFALYFAANFHTQGSQAVYFVPGESRFAGILWWTAIADALAILWLALFLRKWL